MPHPPKNPFTFRRLVPTPNRIHLRKVFLEYRGTSLIRRSPPPPNHRRALGIVLLEGPRGSLFLMSVPRALTSYLYINDFCSRQKRARPDRVLTEPQTSNPKPSTGEKEGGALHAPPPVSAPAFISVYDVYLVIYLSIRCILGDIRLWVGHPSTSSCLVSPPQAVSANQP